MRRRMLTSTMVIVVVSLTVFGAPLVVLLDRVAENAVRGRLERAAANTGLALESAMGEGRPVETVDLGLLTPPGDRVVVLLADGRRLESGDPVDGPALDVVFPLGDLGTLRLSTSDRPVRDRVRNSVAVLVAVGAVCITLGGALAVLQARRLTRPLDHLAVTARRLGAGDFTAVPPRCGVPEIDALAGALDSSRLRIAELLAAERQFSANASHQLRSALTGLRLHLEELTTLGGEDVHVEAREALIQADRLNQVVDELLRLARTGQVGERRAVDLVSLVSDHAADWRPRFRAVHRALTVRGAVKATAEATPGGVAQILDILLSNALDHGRGEVEIDVTSRRGQVVVEVRDQGRGLASGVGDAFARRETPEGRGIGLSLARTLARADGGTLELVSVAPTSFRLSLRAAEPEDPRRPGRNPQDERREFRASVEPG